MFNSLKAIQALDSLNDEQQQAVADLCSREYKEGYRDGPLINFRKLPKISLFSWFKNQKTDTCLELVRPIPGLLAVLLYVSSLYYASCVHIFDLNNTPLSRLLDIWLGTTIGMSILIIASASILLFGNAICWSFKGTDEFWILNLIESTYHGLQKYKNKLVNILS